MEFRLRCFFFLLLLHCAAFAQTTPHPIGIWYMGFNQTRLTERIGIHIEAQARSFELTPNLEQALFRGGLNYHFKGTSFATAGYAFVMNYSFDKEKDPGMLSNEHRLWEQLVMKNNIGRCFFEHRYRLEQRWIHSAAGDRYLDRFRYLIRATVPLNKKEVVHKAVFISVYDEIFMHITKTPFDRNRIYGAIGYQFLPLANFQVGYLAQTVNVTTKHYLQASLFYNLDLRNKE